MELALQAARNYIETHTVTDPVSDENDNN
jgi:hypothetical protein